MFRVFRSLIMLTELNMNLPRKASNFDLRILISSYVIYPLSSRLRGLLMLTTKVCCVLPYLQLPFFILQAFLLLMLFSSK